MYLKVKVFKVSYLTSAGGRAIDRLALRVTGNAGGAINELPDQTKSTQKEESDPLTFCPGKATPISIAITLLASVMYCLADLIDRS